MASLPCAGANLNASIRSLLRCSAEASHAPRAGKTHFGDFLEFHNPDRGVKRCLNYSNRASVNARPTVYSGSANISVDKMKRLKFFRNPFKVLGYYRWDDDEVPEVGSEASFADGVNLFNEGEYYKCHDVLEEVWNNAHDPQRAIVHGVLQCSVGMYHLLNQNHKGAMIEIGEGVNKLKRVCNKEGPLENFGRSMSLVLEFIYNTQLEFAACAEDLCVTMDGSHQSYDLLGNYGAGQALYKLERDGTELYLVFSHTKFPSGDGFGKVGMPVLEATDEDLQNYP